MLEREFPKTDRLRAARSSVSIASRTSAAPVERRLVTQSDGTDQSDGTSGRRRATLIEMTNASERALAAAN